MQTKICKTCGIELPVECFGTFKNRVGGKAYLRSNCRDCSAKLRLEYNHRTGRCAPFNSEEYKRKLSAVRSGAGNSMYGIRLTGEKNHMFGKHPSEETKRKNAEAHRGRFVGEENPHYGKHHSEETRKIISERRKGKNAGDSNHMKRPEVRAKFTGPNHPNWKGGVSFEPYCPKFTKAVREAIRDDFGRKCLHCGLPESENITKRGTHLKLSVHHVYYDKQEGCNGKDFFLVPLCIKCHMKTSNGDRSCWIQTITSKYSEYIKNG